jgi:flagellar biosynthesis component FlhA
MRKQKGFAQIYLVMGVVVLMMAGGFYLYYKDSQATIRAQAQVMAAQQVQIAEHEEIVKQFQEDKALQLEITKQIGIAFDESRQEIDDLRNKFDKINEATQKQRDIGKLASSRKAKRIEKIINNATKNVFRCFEILSGDPLTADELAATKKSQANNECPHIANPNYTAK